jgi:hypothetical protein
LLTVASCLQASNPAGHLYAAGEIRAQLTDTAKAVVDGNLEAYQLGCVAPDIGVLLAMGSETAPGAEAHYRKTGQMILAILREADGVADPARKAAVQAFALGWLTHYVVDNHIHALINQFGGYFGGGADFELRHKALELFENTYVFTEHAAAGLPATLNPAASPQAEVLAAWQKTYYPGHRGAAGRLPAEFTEGPMVELPLLGQRRSGQGWAQMTANMAGAYAAMVQTHQQNANQGGIYAGALGGWQPTPSQYQAIKQPMKIDEVELIPPDPQAGEKQPKLKITYTLNERRLYRAFGRAWEPTMKAAIAQAVGYINAWSASPATFTLPDTNMDTGGPVGDVFDTATAFPANPDLREMLTRLVVKDHEGKAVKVHDSTGAERAGGDAWEPLLTVDAAAAIPEAREVVGAAVPAAWGDVPEPRVGQAYFTVPFEPGEGPPYTADVYLIFQDKATGRPYEIPAAGATAPPGTVAEWHGKLGAKPELSILFLVDCSGSMAGAKLEAAKEAVRAAVQATNDGKTQWSVMHFGNCSVSWPRKFFMNPASIDKCLARLTADGDTPLTYARAVALAECAKYGGTPKGRVVILCDGQDNCTEHGSKSAAEAETSLRALLPPQSLDVPMP